MSPDYQTLVLRLEVDASKWLTSLSIIEAY